MFRNSHNWKYWFALHERGSKTTLLRCAYFCDLRIFIFHCPLYYFLIRGEHKYSVNNCNLSILLLSTVAVFDLSLISTFFFCLQSVIDTLFLCICEDKNLNGDNGKWRQSPLAQIGSHTSTNGQQSHELAPMNQ